MARPLPTSLQERFSVRLTPGECSRLQRRRAGTTQSTLTEAELKLERTPDQERSWRFDVTKPEHLWILRRRAGLTMRDGPLSHVTQSKWESGRAWSPAADAMLASLRNGHEKAGASQ